MHYHALLLQHSQVEHGINFASRAVGKDIAGCIASVKSSLGFENIVFKLPGIRLTLVVHFTLVNRGVVPT